MKADNMDNSVIGGETRSSVLLFSSLFTNLIAYLDKQTITFALGVIVSLLAITNYIIQIRKNLRSKL